MIEWIYKYSGKRRKGKPVKSAKWFARNLKEEGIHLDTICWERRNVVGSNENIIGGISDNSMVWSCFALKAKKKWGAIYASVVEMHYTARKFCKRPLATTGNEQQNCNGCVDTIRTLSVKRWRNGGNCKKACSCLLM